MLVRKLNHRYEEVWSYEVTLIQRGNTWIEVEGLFNIADRSDGFMQWRYGDRLREWFYTDRWYNIFEVHNVDDDALKGWYCNLTYPAVITDTEIAWADLSLDLFVDPRGAWTILDQEEYDALDLSEADRAQVANALSDLQGMVTAREGTFAQIP